MKLLPKILILETEKEQAEYFLDREFSFFDYTDVDSEEWENNSSVIEPDNEILYSDFIKKHLKYEIDYDEELNEYFNMTGYEVTAEDDDFKEWLVDRYLYEFEEWKMEELREFPIWNIIFFAKSNSTGKYLKDNVNELYLLGLTLVSYNGNTGIMVNSAGHDFYTDYWIPLYKNINKWIKEVDDKEYKEKIEREIERLKRLLNN